MARDFGGADYIDFGSDASIDAYPAKNVLAWVYPDLAGGAADFDSILSKAEVGLAENLNSGFELAFQVSAVSTGHLRFIHAWSITDGEWVTNNNSVPNGNMQHIGVSYDGQSTGNDAVFYLNGVSLAVTETSPPAGNIAQDNAQNLQAGQRSDASRRYDGRIGWLLYDDVAITQGTLNRHRWWGTGPGGPSTVRMLHPFVTDATTNRGTATANAVPNGTAMASLPRVERMYGSMMGCGR